MRATLTVVLGFLCSLTLAGAPPAGFDAVIAEMQREFDEVESQEWPDYECYLNACYPVRRRAAERVDAESLTLDQIGVAIGYRLVYNEDAQIDHRAAYRTRLRQLAREPSGQGALAALYLWRLARLGNDDSHRATALRAVRHPGLRDLLTQPGGEWVWYALTSAAYSDNPDPACDAIEDVLSMVTLDFLPGNLEGTASLYETLARHDSERARALAERFRSHLLKVGAGAVAGMHPLTDAWWERRQLAFLNHAPSRMRLLNNPAPDFEFRWWSDDESTPLLSELQGRVVVLDFWASDCGFCYYAFEHLAPIIEEYRDRPVKFVSLADLQGYVVLDYDTDETVATPTLAEEADATRRLIARLGHTWTFALADELAYQPQFGVDGVPSMTVIDHRGIVRAVDLDPRQDREKTVALLDGLLAERESDLRAQQPPE